jgi:hypothetical protein
MAKTVDFYHGTATRNARSIRKTGLRPSTGHTSGLDFAKPKKRVYLSASPENAKRYAHGAMLSTGPVNKRVTVFKVSVPTSIARTFKRDRIGLPGDVYTESAIHPKHISGPSGTKARGAKGSPSKRGGPGGGG